MIDFDQYYNEHADYVQLRNPESGFYRQYLSEVDHWKNKYMGRLLAGRVPDTVLEVGCAGGLLLARFPVSTPQNRRYGIDISSANIEYAKSQFPGMHFQCGDFLKLRHSGQIPRRFGLGILSDILEHVEQDGELLQKVGEHADLVVLNLPLEKCAEYKGREYGLNDKHGHLRAYDLEDARRLIRDAGMVEIQSFVRQYVREPIFRKHLAQKLFGDMKGESRFEGIAQYIQEVNEIDLYPEYYKSNYFGLLQRDSA